jgi:predicted cupin superfamily sugar epimerase
MDTSKKLFACMNIPYFNFKSFKIYEKEAGLAAEKAAKNQQHRCNSIGKEINIGGGRKHRQVIVFD